MQKKLWMIPLFLFVSFITHAQPVADWQNPAVFDRNQVMTHTELVPFETIPKAIGNQREKSDYFFSLNGLWKFHWSMTPGQAPQEFHRPDYDVSQWTDIRVPGNWQTQGFGHPMFRNVAQTFPANPPFVPTYYNPVGSYRRVFSLPESFSERPVYLHFAGVKSASTIWINGHEVGYNEGGMEPAEYEITRWLKSGENQLAVQVLRYSDGTYLEAQDMWRLAGIFREVYLYSPPPVYIRDLYIQTPLDATYQHAKLSLDIQLCNTRSEPGKNFELLLQLYDSDQHPVFKLEKRIKCPLLPAGQTVSLEGEWNVPKAKLWSDEHPHLYTLVIQLLNGESVHVISETVGFRQVEIRNQAILVNGKAVKLNGVNSHQHHPILGRTVDHQTMARDLKLMKQFNINCVRTSHYPPDPAYLDLADSLGIYVIDETGDEAHAATYLSEDPAWREAYIDRARRMVLRDRNHPSIILWSAGNEAGSGPNIAALIAEGKKLDPSRPAWLYGGNKGMLPFEDIIGPRYPSIEYLKEIAQVPAEKDPRPSFMDEYAAATGNSLGTLEEYWDQIYKTPRLTGGAIWDWVSPGLMMPVQLVKDQSHYPAQCALMGRITRSGSPWGMSVDLSGFDEWIEIYQDKSLDFTESELTLCCQIHPRQWWGANPIISKGPSQFRLYQPDSSHISWSIKDQSGSLVDITVPVPGTWYTGWHHLAATFDRNKIRLYIDGQLAAERFHAGHLANSFLPINIGRDPELHGQDYPGRLSTSRYDNIHFFRRALTLEEIRRDQANRWSDMPSDAVLWLNFESVDTVGTYYSTGLGGRAYGLVWPDRKIQPELWQAKKTPQPVAFRAVDLTGATIDIHNRFNFSNLNEFTTSWTLKQDDRVIREQLLQLDVEPGEHQLLHIPLDQLSIEPGSRYWLLLEVRLSKDQPWAKKHHTVAWEQFQLPIYRTGKEFVFDPLHPLHHTETDSVIIVNGKDFQLTIDRTQARIAEWRYQGTQLLQKGPAINLWRAPLDNETDAWGPRIVNQWRQAGLHDLQPVVNSFEFKEIDKHWKRITSQITMQGDSKCYYECFYRYDLFSSGELVINYTVIPHGPQPDWLPRVGLVLLTAKDFDRLTWYGRGPFETYCDRKTAANVDIYEATITEMETPYLVPQEYGNRTDIYWASLSNKNGVGLFVKADEPFETSVHRYGTDHLTRAMYRFQLHPSPYLTWNIDHNVSGVGGTPKSTRLEYRVVPQKFQQTLILKPFNRKHLNAKNLGKKSIPAFLSIE